MSLELIHHRAPNFVNIHVHDIDKSTVIWITAPLQRVKHSKPPGAQRTLGVLVEGVRKSP